MLQRFGHVQAIQKEEEPKSAAGQGEGEEKKFPIDEEVELKALVEKKEELKPIAEEEVAATNCEEDYQKVFCFK
ncbi:MAG TPA: hypothetical protein V6C97_03330 [Oculatellaceae cyanobacterium]